MSEQFPLQYELEPEQTELAQRAGEVALNGAEQDEEAGEYEVLLHPSGDPEKSHMLRRKYLRSTYRLVEKIQENQPDYVLYLDKSARPVAWLTNELYEDFVNDPDNEHESWPKPDTLFLNIDREHWRDETGGKEYGSGRVDVSSIDKSVIDSLRHIFLSRQAEKGEDVTEIDSLLDGKKVLIVDEVQFTGDTIKIARELLKAAFPDAEFDTHHWMVSPKASDPNARSGDLPDVPVWYKDKAERGRGVANRDAAKSRQSRSWRQRVGAFFLSTRFDSIDRMGLRLRKEMKRLAEEYRDGVYGSVVY